MNRPLGKAAAGTEEYSRCGTWVLRRTVVSMVTKEVVSHSDRLADPDASKGKP
jgi:hypothetical protein